ncbi:MBL fold metallo-hydrolase [Dinghuibacter silviterrae]|uniref:L-ascorbate metabolism protein UlaG (Beta-lactamase superfamily) n=1 Tax=Dinghuibacter silviterrae TaxID=1539049 RepID=A0A4R8DRN4_9BACT|nr:MBL fold metallo-hydrolase [Dinghuibacter silviterrae]TDX00872.1 L-ascorbate metabolism protein UlaG (beta-lactamase superfamily) [Dinghuibacter silviterrae]
MKAALLVLTAALLFSTANAQRIAPDVLFNGALTIQPINHATMVLTYKGKTIYVDPADASLLSGLNDPDLILVTDIHGDHYNAKALAAILKPSTILIVPKAVAALLPDDLKARATILNNGENISKLDIGITAIPMYNLPESPTAMHTKGRGNGYVLRLGSRNLYISGDTQGIPEMRALKNIDVAFVCMNLPYTMDIKEASDAVLAFKPKIVYPYHYRGQGGFADVAGFKTLVAAGDPSIDVRLRSWYSSQGK